MECVFTISALTVACYQVAAIVCSISNHAEIKAYSRCIFYSKLWANVRDSRGPRLALLENATRRTLALRNPKTRARVRVLTCGRQAPAIQSEALLPGRYSAYTRQHDYRSRGDSGSCRSLKPLGSDLDIRHHGRGSRGGIPRRPIRAESLGRVPADHSRVPQVGSGGEEVSPGARGEGGEGEGDDRSSFPLALRTRSRQAGSARRAGS